MTDSILNGYYYIRVPSTGYDKRSSYLLYYNDILLKIYNKNAKTIILGELLDYPHKISIIKKNLITISFFNEIKPIKGKYFRFNPKMYLGSKNINISNIKWLPIFKKIVNSHMITNSL